MHALLTVKNVVGVLLVLFPSLGFFMVLSFGLCSYKQNERAEWHGCSNDCYASR
jgi:hypothetical protein